MLPHLLAAIADAAGLQEDQEGGGEQGGGAGAGAGAGVAGGGGIEGKQRGQEMRKRADAEDLRKLVRVLVRRSSSASLGEPKTSLPIHPISPLPNDMPSLLGTLEVNMR